MILLVDISVGRDSWYRIAPGSHFDVYAGGEEYIGAGSQVELTLRSLFGDAPPEFKVAPGPFMVAEDEARDVVVWMTTLMDDPPCMEVMPPSEIYRGPARFVQ